VPISALRRFVNLIDKQLRRREEVPLKKLLLEVLEVASYLPEGFLCAVELLRNTLRSI